MKPLATRHTIYKQIDLSPSSTANTLLSTNLELFLGQIKSPVPHYWREMYRALIVHN